MPRLRSQKGFTLVELLVAVAFTSFLMVGLARVYQASLSSFTVSAEKISAGRRGRVAIDMISDDLNAAGMFLWDINRYPSKLSASNPGFWINPNVVISTAEGTVQSDQILFYYDEALPFEGTLSTGDGYIKGIADLEASGKALDDSAVSFTIAVPDGFANMVQAGQRLIVKDGWPGFKIGSVTVSGNLLTILPSKDYQDEAGAPTGGNWLSKDRHKNGTAVTFMRTAQQVRYSLQPRKLDPDFPTRDIICLVREQADYNSGGFGSPTSTQILAEDVSGLMVFLSVDGGRNWLREPAGTGISKGWDQGYRPLVEAALAGGYGRASWASLSDPNWFREIPILVRVDVKTRTAGKRTEYATAPNTLAYKEQTQSLILKPRHFGLTFN
ncbi:MAG TPA: prepilin-type N-terminal cleavage/methylation domain-containing protein [Holophagaceae bacterium]|nr:prepilin-type N-terminal cleavage/methylation domain-containing protein [Holophagaceae bacterium]